MPNDVRQTLQKAVYDLKADSHNAEIAFFGGSFTAIDRDYMLSLLESTKPFIHHFKGIRISTRPDYIDDEVLILLKKYNITTIELGAQSMNDDVLSANDRGHSSDDVRNASRLIKAHGFKLGLQMMTGLYKSSHEADYDTALEFVKLRPDCVRIYPTIIMKNTELERLYNSGVYKPDTLEQSVELCAALLTLFDNEHIDVIRVGLHYSDSLIEGSVASGYHPAFRELCENRIFADKLDRALRNIDSKNIIIEVNPFSVSKLIGQKRANIKDLEQRGYKIKIDKDRSLSKYGLRIKNNR